MAAEQLTATPTFRVGEWSVRPDIDEVSRGNEVIRLEPRTMRLLLRLAESPGHVVSTQQLLETVWSDVVVGSASVYQAMSQLRKVLGDTEEAATYIETIPRKGYRLIARVDSCTPPPPPPENAVAGSPVRRRRAAYYLACCVAAALALLVILVAQGPKSAPADSAAAILAGNRTIVVLPIEAAAMDEPTRVLAPIVTDLLRTRLATLRGIVVIAGGSTNSALQSAPDMNAVVRRLQAGYSLRGNLKRVGDRIHMNVALVDAGANAPVWSATIDRAVTETEAIEDEIVRKTSDALRIPAVSSEIAGGVKPKLDIGAYDLYLRGQKLVSTYRAADAEQAVAIFSRVTTLDPTFARAFYAHGMALLLAADLGALNMTEELRDEAGKSFERALELNPKLGEAWAQRARLTADPIEAERIFHRALELAPGYDESYLRFSDFLFAQRRRGEALELVDQARQIDPLSAALFWRKAQFLITARGDVAANQQLLREAIEILPTFPAALRDLGVSRWIWSGEFADAALWIERSIAVDRGSDRADPHAVALYLDLDDPAAAESVLRNTKRPDDIAARTQWLLIRMHSGDVKGSGAMAMELANELLSAQTNNFPRREERAYAVNQELLALYAYGTKAILDDAIAKKDPTSALDFASRIYSVFSNSSPLRRRGNLLAYAQALMLAGETRRARELLESLLQNLDVESVGRPAHWFSWERAAAYAMLGDNKRALDELTASQESGRFTGWWYTAERDPVYDQVRSDPRFQRLVENAKKHREVQRALLEEMRRKGEVPRRDS